MSFLPGELSLRLKAGYGLLLIVTHEEQRAVEAAQKTCQKHNLPLSLWSTATGQSQTALDAARAFRQSPDPGVLALLDVLPFLDSDAELTRELREIALSGPAQGKALWMVSPRSDLPPELTKECALIDLPLPDTDELRAGLNSICAERGVLFPEDFLDALVRASGGLTLEEARRVFRKALSAGGGHKLGNVDIVIEEKRQILRRGTVLEAEGLDYTLDDVGGLDELKRWLSERERAFSQDARAFGLPEPRGLLLMGVQGCGKSLSAKAVAGLWRLPLLRLDMAALFGMATKETALREALKVSEAMSPDVLWVDEIDKAFSSAEGAGGRILGTFVTWLQEKKAPVFVVATANEVDKLPPELTRRGRFDAVFFVDLPDVHERKAILALHLARRGRDPAAYDVAKLASQTTHFAGSELEQVVVGGLYRAFAESRQLAQIDMEAEISETVPLYSTYEAQIKALRQWARGRARPASLDRSTLDLFGG